MAAVLNKDILDTKRWLVPNADLILSTIDASRLESLVRDSVASGQIERSRLCLLKDRLDEARIVEPSQMPEGVITMNSTVRFRDLDTGEVETYTLVYPGFADASQQRLSILSPFGAAILGYREGDVINMDPLAGGSRMAIEKVEFQPESVGQYDA